MSDIRQTAYERYKFAWMVEHGYTLSDLMKELQVFQEYDPEDVDATSMPIATLMEEWENNCGFGGAIWSCFLEFLDFEYRDKEYMQQILNPDEYEEYLKDIRRV